MSIEVCAGLVGKEGVGVLVLAEIGIANTTSGTQLLQMPMGGDLRFKNARIDFVAAQQRIMASEVRMEWEFCARTFHLQDAFICICHMQRKKLGS
jgi:hypothetical protein